MQLHRKKGKKLYCSLSQLSNPHVILLNYKTCVFSYTLIDGAVRASISFLPHCYHWPSSLCRFWQMPKTNTAIRKWGITEYKVFLWRFTRRQAEGGKKRPCTAEILGSVPSVHVAGELPMIMKLWFLCEVFMRPWKNQILGGNTSSCHSETVYCGAGHKWTEGKRICGKKTLLLFKMILWLTSRLKQKFLRHIKFNNSENLIFTWK